MMRKPTPTSPSPAPLDIDAYDRETQRLLKDGERMERVTSTLVILVQVFSFLMQYVTRCIPSNKVELAPLQHQRLLFRNSTAQIADKIG